MAIEFNLSEDLAATEASLVDWKRRAKDYESKGLSVPAYIENRIAMLKKDALLLRAQLNR